MPYGSTGPQLEAVDVAEAELQPLHPNTPLVLLILDGWGLRAERDQNAVALADPSTFHDLLARYPNGTLDASGEAVGLPAGQMGNSEVGHTNLGAGRVVYQDLTRIDKSIRDGELLRPHGAACGVRPLP